MLIENDDVVMSFDRPKEAQKWSLVEATIDSGSAVSGLPKSSIEDLSKIQELQGGIQSYTSASEHSCKVLGQMKPVCEFQDGTYGKVAFKVLDPLKKIIISTAQMRRAGYRIVHDDDSYIEYKPTGQRIQMCERRGVYVIKVWMLGVREPPFGGQEHQP